MSRKMKGSELVHYVHGLRPHVQMTVENALDVGVVAPASFTQYANVFNTPQAAHAFVKAHRPGFIVVKVGRKYCPATPEFAKRMGIKPVKEPRT